MADIGTFRKTGFAESIAEYQALINCALSPDLALLLDKSREQLELNPWQQVEKRECFLCAMPDFAAPTTLCTIAHLYYNP